MNKKIQKHVLKDKQIYVGLEDSKKTWMLCVRSGGIVIDGRCSMPAKYEHLRNYFHNKFPGCKIRVMYEAGFRGFNLYDKLVADGWDCVVTPPHTVVEEKCSRLKNDRIDCRRLAKNNEKNDFHSCHVPDRQQREDRQVSRRYEQLKKDIVRTSNRIRRAVEYHGLEYLLPSGAWTQARYRQAEEILNDMELSTPLSFSFQTMFEALKFLRLQQKMVLKQLRALAKESRYIRSVEILRSVPGIGFLTAIRLTLEWGDVSRFKRKESFCAFLGLVPSEYSTGESIQKGHITKQGNRHVRSWLVESSWIAQSRDPALLDKYRRVFASTGSKKKAIVAVARKLAVRLRTLLLTDQEYQIGLIS